MSHGSLFPEASDPVPDEEVIETLRRALARSGRLSRSAEMFLCGLCAEYLVDELHGAGLRVVRASAGHDS